MTTKRPINVDVEAIRASFQRLIEEKMEIGAALCVWQDGKEILSLAAGHTTRHGDAPFTEETLVPVFSATKGLSAAVLKEAMEEYGFHEHSELREIWPELGEGSLRNALCHELGLPYLVSNVQVNDREGIEKDLEAQAQKSGNGPGRAWPLGEGHGYHPRTSGYLWEGLVRRMTGETLQARWMTKWATGRGIDFFIGLPEKEHHRLAPVYPGKFNVRAEERDFYHHYGIKGSLPFRAFRSPKGLEGVTDMNRKEVLAEGYAAFGGAGSARGLAQFYASLLEAPPFAIPERASVDGDDLVLSMRSAFGSGFMFDSMLSDPRFTDQEASSHTKVRSLFGPSPRAFGHPGAGGSLGFCDPENRIAFAFVRNQLELGVLPGDEIRELVASIYGIGTAK